MGIGQAYTTVIHMTPEGLEEYFKKTHKETTIQLFLSPFKNVLVSPEDVANFHNVNVRTVYNYINDGLLIPEIREKKGELYKFRLSDALQINFKDLQKQLRIRNKQI